MITVMKMHKEKCASEILKKTDILQANHLDKKSMGLRHS